MKLPVSKQQFSVGQDYCAGCAYDKGYEDGKEGKQHHFVLQNFDTLPPDRESGDKAKDPSMPMT